MEPTALEEAVLFLLEERREEITTSLKSIQNEIAKGHPMEITLGEALVKIGDIERYIGRLGQKLLREEQMAKEFQCRVIDPARKELFISIFGRDTVSIISPMPMQAHLEGRGTEFVYMFDFSEISREEKEKLVEILAGMFGSSALLMP